MSFRERDCDFPSACAQVVARLIEPDASKTAAHTEAHTLLLELQVIGGSKLVIFPSKLFILNLDALQLELSQCRVEN